MKSDHGSRASEYFYQAGSEKNLLLVANRIIAELPLNVLS